MPLNVTPSAPPKSQFERCLDVTLAFEGGWNDDPADSGGPTKTGITQDTYDHFRRGRELPAQSVHLMTCSECRAIYLHGFYQPLRCGQMALPWAVLVFDTAVLCGPSRAIRWLQEALGVQVDGDIGPATLAALKGSQNDKTKQNYYVGCREVYHKAEAEEFSSQMRFLAGWFARCKVLREMVETGNFTPKPTP